MSLHEIKYCPRCQSAFECKPGNIGQCQCYGLKICSSAVVHIRENYDACLCQACLKEIGEKFSTDASE